MTPFFKDFLEGLAGALLFVGVLLLVLFLAGCASGVQMSDEERIACRNEGCAVFTENELRTMLDSVYAKALAFGYRRGWSDFANQTRRDL